LFESLVAPDALEHDADDEVGQYAAPRPDSRESRPRFGESLGV